MTSLLGFPSPTKQSTASNINTDPQQPTDQEPGASHLSQHISLSRPFVLIPTKTPGMRYVFFITYCLLLVLAWQVPASSAYELDLARGLDVLSPRGSSSDSRSRSPSPTESRSRSQSPHSYLGHGEVQTRFPATGRPSRTTDSHRALIIDTYAGPSHSGPAVHRPTPQTPVRLVPSAHPSHTTHSHTPTTHTGPRLTTVSAVRPPGRPVRMQMVSPSHTSSVSDTHAGPRHSSSVAHQPRPQTPIRLGPSAHPASAGSGSGSGSRRPHPAGESEEERRVRHKKIAEDWGKKQKKKQADQHPSKHHDHHPKGSPPGSPGGGSHAVSKRSADAVLAPRGSSSDSRSRSPSPTESRSRSQSPHSYLGHGEVQTRFPATGHPSRTTHPHTSSVSDTHAGPSHPSPVTYRPATHRLTPQTPIRLVPGPRHTHSDTHTGPSHPRPAAHRPTLQTNIRLRPFGSGSQRPRQAGRGRLTEEERRERNKKFAEDWEKKSKHTDEHPSKHHEHSPKGSPPGSPGGGSHAVSKRSADAVLAPRGSSSDSRSRSPSPQSPPHHAEVQSRPPASGHPSHTTHSHTSDTHTGPRYTSATGIRPPGTPVRLRWTRPAPSHTASDTRPVTHGQSPIRLVPAGNTPKRPKPAGKGPLSKEQSTEKNKKFKTDKHADQHPSKHHEHSPKGSPPGSPGAGSHAVSKRSSQEAFYG